MIRRWLTILLVCSCTSFAGIVEDVRVALQNDNPGIAEKELADYRASHNATPEYLEAASWMARSALGDKNLGAAESYARQTEVQVRQLIKTKPLDSNPHLPIALGAALEVQAQVLEQRGEHARAVAFLQRALADYGNTSIKSRLQKNLNLLSLTGQTAPLIRSGEFLGPKPPAWNQLSGSPVLLFFWAHWCPDCKVEGPIITRLRKEFSRQGLVVMAPTQYYGYAARGEEAKPEDELVYIGQVWQKFYPGLLEIPVPVSKLNFDTYGASTTPTLVLVNRAGKVVMYHPGAMSYEDLHAAIEKVVSN